MIAIMDGGIRAGRLRCIPTNICDFEYYKKSLPTPPSGFRWERESTGAWNLIRKMNQQKPAETTKVCSRNLIEHTIMPGETLQGICLRYKTSPTVVRQYNMFSGNSITGFKVLKIPVEGGVEIVLQAETQEVLIQKFRNVTNEGKEEAKLYLEEHHWDLNNALNAFHIEDSWALANKEAEDHWTKVEFASNTESEKEVAPVAVIEASASVACSKDFEAPVVVAPLAVSEDWTLVE